MIQFQENVNKFLHHDTLLNKNINNFFLFCINKLKPFSSCYSLKENINNFLNQLLSRVNFYQNNNVVILFINSLRVVLVVF